MSSLLDLLMQSLETLVDLDTEGMNVIRDKFSPIVHEFLAGDQVTSKDAPKVRKQTASSAPPASVGQEVKVKQRLPT